RNMRYIKGLPSGLHVAVLCALLSGFSIHASAQGQGGQGQNAVYPSSGTCCMGSQAFIDASMFATTNGDICTVLKGILDSSSYPSTGAVIDARGLTTSNPVTSMTCHSATPSPWSGIANPPPSTILLPATGGTGNPAPPPSSSPLPGPCPA